MAGGLQPNVEQLLKPRAARQPRANRRQSQVLAILQRSHRPPGAAVRPRDGGYDVVLSSGFCAFASHCGFLQAVEDAGVQVNGVMGTSAGALTGSLYCAGYSPVEIADEFRRVAPINRARLQPFPWRGLMSLDPAVEALRALLPPRFEELPHEFAVGVVSRGGAHALVNSGSLPEAVAASAAVPLLFQPVHIPGSSDGPYIDGGVRCRIGLDLWRRQRYAQGAPPAPALVHLIGRSSPFSGNDNTTGLAAQGATVVHSSKSGASLWDLAGFDEQFELARSNTAAVLNKLNKLECSSASAPARHRPAQATW